MVSRMRASLSCLIAVAATQLALADVPLGSPTWSADNPLRAVREFLAAQPPEGPRFEIDSSCEKFITTFAPNGFLRRVG